MFGFDQEAVSVGTQQIVQEADGVTLERRCEMGFKAKIQLIKRKDSQQFYINFPSACAQMMGFRKEEVVEWVLADNGDLLLKRTRCRRGACKASEDTTEK